MTFTHDIVAKVKRGFTDLHESCPSPVGMQVRALFG